MEKSSAEKSFVESFVKSSMELFVEESVVGLSPGSLGSTTLNRCVSPGCF